MPSENQIGVSGAPAVGNLKRSCVTSALSPKDRHQAVAKSFEAPTPFPPIRKGRGSKKANSKPRMAPSPVSVPPKSSPLSTTERYMSPTDSLVSPVTKGVLARNRRPMRLLNPWGPPKALENTFQGTVQTLKPTLQQR